MKDQANRLLNAIERGGGDTQGWYKIGKVWVTGSKAHIDATPTEIKALAWELAMIIQETLVLHDRCWTKEPADEYDDDRWFVQHRDPIEALLLASEKVGGEG